MGKKSQEKHPIGEKEHGLYPLFTVSSDVDNPIIATIHGSNIMHQSHLEENSSYAWKSV